MNKLDTHTHSCALCWEISADLKLTRWGFNIHVFLQGLVFWGLPGEREKDREFLRPEVCEEKTAAPLQPWERDQGAEEVRDKTRHKQQI